MAITIRLSVLHLLPSVAAHSGGGPAKQWSQLDDGRFPGLSPLRATRRDPTTAIPFSCNASRTDVSLCLALSRAWVRWDYTPCSLGRGGGCSGAHEFARGASIRWRKGQASARLSDWESQASASGGLAECSAGGLAWELRRRRLLRRQLLQRQARTQQTQTQTPANSSRRRMRRLFPYSGSVTAAMIRAIDAGVTQALNAGQIPTIGGG